MKSKLLLSLLFVSGLAACSSSKQPPAPQPITIKWEQTPMAHIDTKPVNQKPVYELKNYDGPEVLDNGDVISLSRGCISVQLKPKVTYLSIRTDSGSLKVPVGVTCENW
jgi:hypothetical protein